MPLRPIPESSPPSDGGTDSVFNESSSKGFSESPSDAFDESSSLESTLSTAELQDSTVAIWDLTPVDEYSKVFFELPQDKGW